eukprot:14547471-Heterocapsa_arctica.AAC.1
MRDLGWVDNTPTNITYHNGVTRDLTYWPSFVKDGIDRARQLAWGKSCQTQAKYTGVEGGVD